MHPIHHTEAIVIRSEPSGEANKRVWLLTDTFGLIVAVVQGVRKPEAKLKSHVTDYGVIAADLIKGKHTWRLVSATVRDAVINHDYSRNPLVRAYVRTIAFLERFLVGEGAQPELYAHVRTVGAMIGGQYDPRAVDALSLWKMLAILGYIAIDDADEELFTLPFEQAIMLVDDMRIKKLIQSATDAITSSHL